MSPEISVENLSVSIGGKPLLEDISFSVSAQEHLGIIGLSGSGKSMCARAILGILPEEAHVSGRIVWKGQDLLRLSERERAAVRGEEISLIFQEPKTALDPLRTLGSQMTAALCHHYSLSRAQRRAAAIELARSVGLEPAERFVRMYPHEVSGGQRQRAAIAAALSAQPQLLIADEPTTALDAVLQHEITQLLSQLAKERAMSLLFISHDISLVSRLCERILVFDRGRIIERGTVSEILNTPQHETTIALTEAAQSFTLPHPEVHNG